MSRRSGLLAALAGTVVAIGWLPWGLAPLIPICYLLFGLAIDQAQSYRDAVKLGLVFGAFRYLVASHFLLALLSYSPLAVMFYLMATLYVLPFAIFEACGSLWLERRAGLARPYGVALLYVLGEWLRNLGDLSFPADLLSHAWGSHPSASWCLAPVVGPFGMTLWVTLIGAGLARAIIRRRTGARWQRAAILWCALWIAPFAIGALLPHTPKTTVPLQVGIVQPMVTVEQKLAALHRDDRSYWELMIQLSRQAARSKPDLIVWPETARPGRVIWQEGSEFHDPEVEQIARELGVPILYGAEIVQARGTVVQALYNGAALAHPDGRPGQWYGKQRLLPFAEGIPFASVLGLDPEKRTRKATGSGSVLTLLGNFTAGPEATIFEVGAAKIGVLICYEGMYPQLTREYSQRGANLLAVLTNDLWWGRSVFAPWHAQMVIARASETGLPVLRAANSGVSSITDRAGSPRRKSGLLTQEVFHVDAQLETAPPETWFVRIGHWPIGAILMFLAIAVLRGRRG